MRVLVLDASERPALAATRSLGRAGHAVVAADERRNTLAGASRFSCDEWVYPSPYSDPRGFIAWAEENLPHVDAALPVTEVTTDLLARHRSRWPDLRLPLAPIETIDGLSNKIALHERACALGVKVPRSTVVSSAGDVRAAAEAIGLPAVLKPSRSRIWRGGRAVSTAVVRIERVDQAEALMSERFYDVPCLYQELISGPAEGLFALYDRGKPLTFFAHRRLREKPPSGGVSVLSESCAPDPELMRMSRLLLDDARWHGVAMVEFKGGYLMEVNARFWGSLQLAVDAGVDFPRMALELTTGFHDDHGYCSSYRTGCRLRWFLGDLDRMYLITKQAAGSKRSTPLMPELGRFLRPDPAHTRHEVFRWSDPLPAWAEMRSYIRALVQR